MVGSYTDVWIGWLGHIQISVDWVVASHPDECGLGGWVIPR